MNSLPLRAATGYEVLLANEEHFHSKPMIQNHRRKWHIVTILLWIFVALLSLWGALNLFSTMLNHIFPPKEVDCNCGSSIAEALLKGCKYDAMATSWLPPACRDDELSAEFDSAGPGGRWDYYADIDGNRSYTLEEVALLAEKKGPEAEFWTTHEWHINHCLFYWRKESRARVSGKVVIEKSFEGDYHVHHCSKTLTACRPLNEINTKSVAGLNSDL